MSSDIRLWNNERGKKILLPISVLVTILNYFFPYSNSTWKTI